MKQNIMQRISFALIFFSFLINHSLFAEKVGLLIVATDRYAVFVDPLVESARKYFCKNHDVTYFVFSNNYTSHNDDVVSIYHPRLGWPYDTMMRFHAYLEHQHILASQDYLYALDADMLFVNDVGDEILGDLVATLSPGFTSYSPYPRIRGDYDPNPASTAYVKPEIVGPYLAGGFFGGKSEEIFKMLQTVVRAIQKDLSIGYIAKNHDESHLNRYCIDHPPTIILSPSYCYPEKWKLPFTKRLLALDKDHDELRKE